jgi:hypothetical protein
LHAMILQNLLKILLSPLLHSPGGYLNPAGHPTPPVSPWGAPYLSPLALALVETEADHLESPTPSLPLRPNQRAHPSLCISLSPQASPLPLPCTTAANPPPTRSVHVTPGTFPFSTPRSLLVLFLHARELHRTPALHWRSRPCSLAR